jgi:sec-independent protein translocase protein TatA
LAPDCVGIRRPKGFVVLNLGPTELIIVLLIVMVLFGAARLPKLARSLGESAKEFKHAQAVIGHAADDPIEKKA